MTDIHEPVATLPNPQPQPTGKITYDAFLKDYDGIHAEWVDGEVVLFEGFSVQHQEILGFISAVLYMLAQAFDLGEVYTAGINMKIGARGREPDVLFVKKENLGRLKDSHLEGAADLAVEIVSPDSIGRDTKDKYKEYAEAGVTEYWLIDPQKKKATFYQLDANKKYQNASSSKYLDETLFMTLLY